MTTRFRARGWLLPAAVLACAVPTVGLAQDDAATADEAWQYRITKGDTLIDLAAAYLDKGRDWRALQRLNRVADPMRLVPGSRLTIPIRWLRKSATLATASFVQGDVKVQHGSAATAPVDPVEAGATLQAGDLIRTGPGASATLRFADGSRLLIVGDSQVAIERLLVYGRSNIPSIRLRLDRGGADSKVVPNTGRARGYDIRSPTVNLGVRGTEFRARVAAEDGATRVEVLDGRVSVDAGRRETAVAAGFGTVAEPGRPPSPAQRLIGTPDLAGVPQRIERLPLRFAWQPLPGATAYRAQVLADGSDEHLLLDGQFPAPAAKWADLPDGRYRLRVRALDARALEGIDAVTSFVLKARPEPPFTVQPAADAKVYGPTAEFAWSRSQAAATYRLQVAASADFSAMLADRGDIAETRITLPLAPGVYHWRVASITAAGDAGPFGDAQSFAQRELPPDPAVEAPEPAPGGLMLRWRAPQPGETVQFQVATDAAFGQVIVDQRSTEGQALLPNPAPGRYYLRARSIDSEGFAGDYGAAQQIDVPAGTSKWWLLLPAGVLWLLF